VQTAAVLIVPAVPAMQLAATALQPFLHTPLLLIYPEKHVVQVRPAASSWSAQPVRAVTQVFEVVAKKPTAQVTDVYVNGVAVEREDITHD